MFVYLASRKWKSGFIRIGMIFQITLFAAQGDYKNRLQKEQEYNVMMYEWCLVKVASTIVTQYDFLRHVNFLDLQQTIKEKWLSRFAKKLHGDLIWVA